MTSQTKQAPKTATAQDANASPNTSPNISPGMTISIDGGLYRVESCVKVTVAKGKPFIKAKLKNINTDEVIEKSFKLDQTIASVSLSERHLEFLYFEKKHYLFLDIDTLEQVFVPQEVVKEKANFLKEGVDVKATQYGELVYAIELPAFLELMIVSCDENDEEVMVTGVTKTAVLETGAKVEVPPFIKIGDVIKVDTTTGEYIQRV